MVTKGVQIKGGNKIEKKSEIQEKKPGENQEKKKLGKNEQQPRKK